MTLATPALSAGRPSKLTPELIEEVARLSAKGLPAPMIRQVVDVSKQTWTRWLREAEEPDAPPNHLLFRDAVSSGPIKLTESYLSSLHSQAANGNVTAITWLLTHHPDLRDHFSDAAADRRTERKVFGVVADAMTASALPPDIQRRFLLELQSRGLGVI